MCNVTFLSPGGTLPRYNVFFLSSLSSWCCCISPYSHVRSGFLASGAVAGVGGGAGADTFGRNSLAARNCSFVIGGPVGGIMLGMPGGLIHDVI